MQRTLITGANGFVGQQLCRSLQKSGHHVIAVTSREGGPTSPGQETYSCDIREAHDFGQIVRATRPSHIVHLAAITHIPTSFEKPQLTWQTNVMGSINVLEAVRSFAPDCFVLFVSSADVYGAAFKQNTPVDEGAACAPQNPYAASKLAAETAFYDYFRRGIRGVVARPFNHIGAHQSPDFVTASFARQIALIEAGKQEPIVRVGNLQASRDFLDVVDVCRAYERLLAISGSSRDLPKCFNVSSGRSHRIAEILDTLIQMSPSTIAIEPDADRMRPSDIPFAAGNSQRLQQLSGWAPTISLNDTLRDLLNYWRAEVVAG